MWNLGKKQQSGPSSSSCVSHVTGSRISDQPGFQLSMVLLAEDCAFQQNSVTSVVNGLFYQGPAICPAFLLCFHVLFVTSYLFLL